MAQGAWVNRSGTWVKASNVWINVNGVWKQLVRTWINVGGVWKECTTPIAFSLDITTVFFPPAGDYQYITVTAAPGVTWTVTETTKLLQIIESPTSGSGSGGFTITCTSSSVGWSGVVRVTPSVGSSIDINITQYGSL